MKRLRRRTAAVRFGQLDLLKPSRAVRRHARSGDGVAAGTLLDESVLEAARPVRRGIRMRGGEAGDHRQHCSRGTMRISPTAASKHFQSGLLGTVVRGDGDLGIGIGELRRSTTGVLMNGRSLS